MDGTEIFADYGVFGVHQLADDSLFIITQELGLFKWQAGGLRRLPDDPNKPIDQLGVFGSVRLYDGDFALNTFGNGVVVINENGEIQHILDRNIGIRSNIVQHIYQDRDLNLWLALENGISKVNYHSPMSYFDEKAGVEGNVQTVIRFKDQIFVATSHGLYVQTNQRYSARRFKNLEIVGDQVWDFLEVGDELLVASANGIFKSKDGNTENGFNEIKATKVAVAGFTSEDQAYEEHTIDLKTGLKFYMTSDGYADQFGGEKNKKFKIKNMKNLIVEMANEPFEDQKQKLEKELLAWMGDCEQVDDVCVIGFEVG